MTEAGKDVGKGLSFTGQPRVLDSDAAMFSMLLKYLIAIYGV